MDTRILSSAPGRFMRFHLLVLIVSIGLGTAQSQTDGSSDSAGQRRHYNIFPSIDGRVYSTLAKVDLGLELLSRRIDSIDSKMTRIESKIDESDWTKDGTIHIRPVEFAGYIDIQLSRITTRLDMLEREIRELRYSPRSAEENGRSSCRGCTHVKDSSPIREMMSQVVTDNAFRLEDAMKWQIREQTAAMWERLERSLGDLEENVFNQINDTLNVIALGCNQKTDSSDLTDGTEDQDLSFLVQKSLTQSETKFRKLDSDVEKYTRKVMGSIRDLWASSNQVKVSLEEALRQGNQTREVVRHEFSKLHQQIEPLPRLEPRLAEISATLHRNLGDLGATVDRSFASLLVAQNTFIDNCRRLHDEETHAYDVLQAVVHEMRNRSENDIVRISTDIQRNGDRLGRNFEAVLEAIFALGNSTAEKMSQLSSKIGPHGMSHMATPEAAEMPRRNSGSAGKSSPDYEQDYNLPENDYVDV